jgi:hypothetical protein
MKYEDWFKSSSIRQPSLIESRKEGEEGKEAKSERIRVSDWILSSVIALQTSLHPLLRLPLERVTWRLFSAWVTVFPFSQMMRHFLILSRLPLYPDSPQLPFSHIFRHLAGVLVSLG